MPTPEENKAIVRRMVEEGTNGGNTSVFDEVISPDAVDHTAPPSQEPGPEGVKKGHAAFKAAFPDAHATMEEMAADGDLVAYRVTMRATNEGPFMGLPPTGRSFEASGMNLVRLKDGKLVEHWSYLDTMGMLAQLGVLRMPGAPAGPGDAPVQEDTDVEDRRGS